MTAQALGPSRAEHHSPVIHDLDPGGARPIERRPAWALPAVAALCVLAFVAVANAARGPREPAPTVTLVREGDPVAIHAPAQVVVPSLPPGWEAARAAERGEYLAPAVVRLPPVAEIPDGGVLALPAGSYSSVTRLPNAVSGSTAQEEPILRYRYRLNDGRFVVLVRVPKADPFRGIDPSSYTASGLQVRGTDARVLVSTGAPQLVVLVWTEGIRSYQLSSGTLSVAELIAVAEQLR